ncbi:hypothetical protein Ahy_A03g012642 [Arachis hypogaea]|uniref:Uncharacterized protein n=1 Tax=Arachis hypogaea TaxID=3818 RepID=A0A445DTW9_ARAHY|nr:hypothetical protein Ahy_A03g012642 [Arachis hypogaea]
MIQKIQNSPPNVTIIFTLHASWSGWKEVKLALCVIRKWFSTLPSNNRCQLRGFKHSM